MGEEKFLTERGVTLVELVLALGISLIITGAVYATYVSQNRSFSAQDRVSEMNSNSKIALDIIVDDLRMAGFGVPDNLASIQRTDGCPGINGFVQKVEFTNNDEAEDQITLLGAYRQAGNLASAVSSGSIHIDLKNHAEILNDTDRSYISIDGLSFALVKTVSEDQKRLTLSSPIDRSFPAEVPVYLIENVTYRVVKGRLQKVRRLAGRGCSTVPDTDIVAENIEDLQFGMVDAGGDGTTDRVRANILTCASRPDPDFQEQGNPPSKIEDREHAAKNDGLRRRWWQMEVALRNPQ